MIRKLLLSSVAIAAATSMAYAADLPSRRAPPVFVPPPVGYTWTGFYIGGQLGYAFGKDNGRAVADPAGLGPDIFYQVGTPQGVIGGAHFGYNLSTQSLPVLGQLAGTFSGLPLIGGFGGTGGVVGVEGDIDGTNYRGGFFDPATGVFNRVTEQVTGSIRGRIGIAIDRALFYATGGVAFGQFTESYGAGIPNLGPQATIGSFTNTRIGYTVGGGAEYALTTNFSLRAEYRYTDYGRFVNLDPLGIAAAGGAGFDVQHHEYQNRVQVGFSYKFENPIAAPVVARY